MRIGKVSNYSWPVSCLGAVPPWLWVPAADDEIILCEVAWGIEEWPGEVIGTSFTRLDSV